MTSRIKDLPRMQGAGGGKGKGGGSTPKEAPNTLQSNTIVKLMEIIGEGPINRLVGEHPEQAIILNAGQSTATPLMSVDGRMNFQGALADYRLGDPWQEPMKGFDDQVTTIPIQTPVKNEGDPIGHAVIRRVGDLDTAAARVVIQVDALVNIDTKTGDQNGHTVEYCIDVKQAADQPGSSFIEKVHDRISGKTTSPWQTAYRIPLDGNGPWDIRVRRISPDDTSSTKQSGTSWALLEQITEYKLGYPYVAYVGLTADTSQFGTGIPSRGYLVEGLIVQVPSNYDAVNRTYNGIWDGTFTTAYTNNPAWVLYDLLSNNRYGLGDLFTAQRLSLAKWDLYAIAKYADANNARPGGSGDNYGPTGKHGVPDGKGGWEPRFTFNATINTREKAYECIAAISGMMRSAMLWAGGQARFMQDRPMKAVKIFSPANVIDGMFNYTGTALRARHTAVRVLWMNPDKGWDADDVVVEDTDAIVRYGYNLKEETAYGCTSYGQALRHARNILVTERMETDSVQFRIGSGEIDMLPGQVCDISDPSMTQIEWGGRVAQHTLTSITFDRDIEFDPSRTYTLTVVLADGSLKDMGISNPGATARTVALASAFDANNRPVPNAMYAISSDVLKMRSFRLVTIGTEGDGTFKMAATQYAVNKFGEIETGLKEAPVIYSDLPPTDVVQPPTNLRLNYSSVRTSSTTEGVLEVEWDASPDLYLAGYYMEYQYGFDDWVRLPLQKATTVRLMNPKLLAVRVRVYAINMGGLASTALTKDVDLSTGTAEGKALITNLTTIDGGTIWNGRDLHVRWDAKPAYGDGSLQTDGQDPFFRNFRVRVLNAVGTQLGVYYTTDTKFTLTYDQMVALGLARVYRIAVSIQDVNSKFSDELNVEFSNPAPALISPTIVSTITGAILRFDTPSTDPDFVGYLVWMGGDEGFQISDANRVWYSSGNPILTIPASNTRWIRYALYDGFGLTGLNISSAIQITAQGPEVLDAVPPGTPTGLVLTTGIQIDATTGEPVATVVANWNPNPDADIYFYEVAIQQNGSNFVSQSTAETYYTFVATSGVEYGVKLRAVDKMGNRSGYTAVVEVVAARDEIPPGPPTSLAVQGIFGGFRVEWQNPADGDLAHAEVWEGDTDDIAGAYRLGTVNAQAGLIGQFTRSGLSPGVTKRIWVKAVDTSGNVSQPAGPVAATSKDIEFSDFDLSIQPIGKVDVLPDPNGYYGPIAVVLSTDKKLYRLKDGVWNKDVDGSDLIAGSVRAYAIAATQITARELAIGDFQNLILNYDFVPDELGAQPKGWNRFVLGNDGNNKIEVAEIIATGWPAGKHLRMLRHEQGNQGEISATVGNYNADADTAMLGGVPTELNDEFYFQAPVWGNNGSVLLVELLVRTSPTQLYQSWVAEIPLDQGFTPRTAVLKNQFGKGKAYFRFWHKPGSATANDAELRIFTPLLARRNGGKLIVDGAILARQINVDDIFATNAFAQRFTGGEFRTDASLPGTITIGSTGVSISTVKDNADAALASIGLISSDNWLTKGEKSQVIKEWQAIDAEATTINDQAVAQGIQNDWQVTAWNERRGWLAAYLTSLSPYWGDVGSDTPINGNEFRAKFNDYYTYRTILQNYMTNTAYGLAAQDVVTRANAGSTKIDAGVIRIFGDTLLTNWSQGGDMTKIAGGALSANTVAANAMKIGARGIQIQDLTFEANVAEDRLYWTGGAIIWVNDAGQPQVTGIAAGSTQMRNVNGQLQYAYIRWDKGAGNLAVGSYEEAIGPDAVWMACYRGAARFEVLYGGTIINGVNITTGSITADQVKTYSLTADRMNVQQLSAITGNVGILSAGSITSQNGQTVLDLTNNTFVFNASSFLIREAGTYVSPFSLVDGQIRLTNLTVDGNVIVTGTINGAKITEETISTRRLVQNSVTVPQTINFADAYINSTVYQSGGGYTYNYVGYPNGDYEYYGYEPEYGGQYYNYVGPGNGDYTFAYTSPTYSGGTTVGETDWINLGADGRLGGALVVVYGTVNASSSYDAAQQHILLVDRDDGAGWVVAKTNIAGVSTNNGDTKSQIPISINTTVAGVQRVKFRLLAGTYNVRGSTPGGSASSLNNITVALMGGLR